jgi:predicted Fe-S protein YdhL (DUF1289 family)
MISNAKKRISSPCINNCCLDEKDVCVGCYRTISEIIGWRNKPESQKELILLHCKQRKTQKHIRSTLIN